MFKKRIKKKEIELEPEDLTNKEVSTEESVLKFNKNKRQKLTAGSTLENKNTHYDKEFDELKFIKKD